MMKAGAHDYILKGNLTRLVPAVQREIEQARRRGSPRQLEAERQKLLHAVEHSPAAVVITDSKGNIEYVNPKFTRVTGYSSGRSAQRNPKILKSGELSPDDLPGSLGDDHPRVASGAENSATEEGRGCSGSPPRFRPSRTPREGSRTTSE